MKPLTTLDGRYLVVRGRLWRTTSPGLSEQERERLFHELMEARRAVKSAKFNGDADALETARGSPPFSRTLTRRPIQAMRSVHVKA